MIFQLFAVTQQIFLMRCLLLLVKKHFSFTLHLFHNQCVINSKIGIDREFFHQIV
jgi:hypothetical protein